MLQFQLDLPPYSRMQKSPPLEFGLHHRIWHPAHYLYLAQQGFASVPVPVPDPRTFDIGPPASGTNIRGYPDPELETDIPGYPDKQPELDKPKVPRGALYILLCLLYQTSTLDYTRTHES